MMRSNRNVQSGVVTPLNWRMIWTSEREEEEDEEGRGWIWHTRWFFPIIPCDVERVRGQTQHEGVMLRQNESHWPFLCVTFYLFIFLGFCISKVWKCWKQRKSNIIQIAGLDLHDLDAVLHFSMQCLFMLSDVCMIFCTGQMVFEPMVWFCQKSQIFSEWSLKIWLCVSRNGS